MVIIGRSPDDNGCGTIRRQPSLRSGVRSRLPPCPHWGKLWGTSALSGQTKDVGRVAQVMVSCAEGSFVGTMGVPVAGPGRGLELAMGVLTGFSLARGHAPPEPGLSCFAHGGTSGAERDGVFQIMSGRQRMGPRVAAGRGGAGRAGTSWRSHRRDNRWPICQAIAATPSRPAADPAPGHTGLWQRR